MGFQLVRQNLDRNHNRFDRNSILTPLPVDFCPVFGYFSFMKFKRKNLFNIPGEFKARRDKMSPQAARIIKKFGGVKSLCAMLNAVGEGETWVPSSIYRWTYPVGTKGGTGGTIPTRALRLIVKAARIHGILITVNDFYPELL